TIQYEMGIGRMGPHQRIMQKFEINSTNIDESSVFRLDEFTFIIRSAGGEGDYTVQKTGNNKLTLVCNCNAYLKNPALCKHIFVVSQKFNIEMPEQATYFLPHSNDIPVINEQ
ncbi:14778_t:CDS:1, partial [Racocetra fulgida]